MEHLGTANWCLGAANRASKSKLVFYIFFRVSPIKFKDFKNLHFRFVERERRENKPRKKKEEEEDERTLPWFVKKTSTREETHYLPSFISFSSFSH